MLKYKVTYSVFKFYQNTKIIYIPDCYETYSYYTVIDVIKLIIYNLIVNYNFFGFDISNIEIIDTKRIKE